MFAGCSTQPMEKTVTHTIPQLKSLTEPKPKVSVFPLTGYVRLKQIIGPHGPLPISRSSFLAGVKVGKFPKSHKISERVTVWKAEEINELMAAIERGEAWRAREQGR